MRRGTSELKIFVITENIKSWKNLHSRGNKWKRGGQNIQITSTHTGGIYNRYISIHMYVCIYIYICSVQGKRCRYRQQQAATISSNHCQSMVIWWAALLPSGHPKSQPTKLPNLRPSAYNQHLQQPPQQQREHWKLLTWWKFQRKLRIKKRAKQ